MAVAGTYVNMVLRRYTYDGRKKWSRRFVLVLLGCLLILAYFVHHTITGKHGIEARARLVERSRHLEREIAALDAVRARLQRDVTLLRADPPHPDVVEDVAIGLLGMTRPQDIIVLLRRPGESAPPPSAR